jgi:GT2 family glycosyltransferase
MTLMDPDASQANHNTLAPEKGSEKGPDLLISVGLTPFPTPFPGPLGRVRVDGKFFARGGQRLRIQGVTYGPFAPNAGGDQFPSPEAAALDFARMRAIRINSLRTYHLPPEWFLELADQEGMTVFVDVPWSKHLCFLDSPLAQEQARSEVRRAAERGRGHPCILAYSIGNEIPPNIVRWHGTRRVERFLADLADVARQADPECLCTYGNYPSTEYLGLSFLDFATFNVYLHDRETFRRYLFRLQNLVGDKPLLMGELGMDTLGHGETEQARFLQGHVREATLMGVAGSFVFSWTDDWYTGGFPVQNWAFGITRADRIPKASYHALGEVFQSTATHMLEQLSGPSSTPRVSVVVCSYNGGRTLDQCLRSLLALDYPDYEVIVVDDGSTDDTRTILSRFQTVKAIHQENRGLSAARNVGLWAAGGSIIAYTDADCFADPHWLTHLVYQLQHSDAAAVGGPNLSPEDGKLAACVAASPGQPMHVLESDQVAEHIPGCNMAFRKAVLESINGFDPQYKRAGDDVDVCWRLQQAGYWIAFAPGAFVWHHRRQTPRAYLRQQAGYGEAEALLRFKHPDRFNGRGDGKWRGVLYGPSLRGLHLDDALIYRGTFGTSYFQCLYQPAPAHWAMVPATLEWHLLAGLAGLAALHWPLLWFGVAAMLLLSLVIAALQAIQARLAPKHDGWRSRLLVMALCYLQPLVRSWTRYWTRLFAYRPPSANPPLAKPHAHRLPLSGRRSVHYWSEEGYDRTELLGLVIAHLNERGWGKTIDSGWENWDVEVYCHPWTVVQICTAQEDHGNGKRLMRVRYHLRPSGYTRTLGFAAFLAAAIAGLFLDWTPLLATGVFLAAALVLWWRGTRRAAQVVGLVDTLARELHLVRIEPSALVSDKSGALPAQPERANGVASRMPESLAVPDK